MSKKSKSGKKKHQFKYAQPSEPAVAAPTVETTVSGSAGTYPVVLPGTNLRSLKNDLRRIGVLAAGLVALEFLLWYLLSYTSLGPAVYKLLAV